MIFVTLMIMVVAGTVIVVTLRAQVVIVTEKIAVTVYKGNGGGGERVTG